MEEEQLQFYDNLKDYDYKKLRYLLDLKETENIKLNNEINELKDKINSLLKEIFDLKAVAMENFKTDKMIKILTDNIENLEKEKVKIVEDCKSKEQEYRNSNEQMKKKLERTNQNLTNFLELNNTKIELCSSLEKLCNVQGRDIDILNSQIEKNEALTIKKIENIKLKNDIRFNDLKKKMCENIENTQKTVEKMNISHVDISTRLILLQNNQLIADLEYQNRRLEELEQNYSKSKKENFELRKELEFHLDVEKSLAEKNKKCLEAIDIITKEKINKLNNDNQTLINQKSRNTIFSDSKTSFFSKDGSTKNFTLSNDYLYNKVKNLERELLDKKESLDLLKINYEGLKENVCDMKNKQMKIIKLIEVALENLVNDESIKKDKEIYLNIEKVKNLDFSSLSKEKQYSLLMMLMKNLLPNINVNELNPSVKNNIINSTIKFKTSLSSIEDNKDFKLFIRHNKSQSNFHKPKILDIVSIKKMKDKKLQIPKQLSIINNI
jgi:hypothetical protein